VKLPAESATVETKSLRVRRCCIMVVWPSKLRRMSGCWWPRTGTVVIVNRTACDLRQRLGEQVQLVTQLWIVCSTW